MTKPRTRGGDEVTDALGRACEDAVLAALTRSDRPRPTWILKVRRARAQEDKRGVDVVVETDVGRLFLQVKRSHAFVAEWLRRWGRDPRPIGVVVAREDEDEAVILGRALGALILLREKLEQAQRGARSC